MRVPTSMPQSPLPLRGRVVSFLHRMLECLGASVSLFQERERENARARPQVGIAAGDAPGSAGSALPLSLARNDPTCPPSHPSFLPGTRRATNQTTPPRRARASRPPRALDPSLDRLRRPEGALGRPGASGQPLRQAAGLGLGRGGVGTPRPAQPVTQRGRGWWRLARLGIGVGNGIGIWREPPNTRWLSARRRVAEGIRPGTCPIVGQRQRLSFVGRGGWDGGGWWARRHGDGRRGPVAGTPRGGGPVPRVGPPPCRPRGHYPLVLLVLGLAPSPCLRPRPRPRPLRGIP